MYRTRAAAAETYTLTGSNSTVACPLAGTITFLDATHVRVAVAIPSRPVRKKINVVVGPKRVRHAAVRH